MSTKFTRRAMLGTIAAGGTAALSPTTAAESPADDPHWKITKGRIHQSVVQWCFKPMAVEDLARHAASLGLKSVELCPPADWPILKKYGLTCAIAGSHGFVKGWNHRENWDFCADSITKAVTASADFGCPSVITFSGMRGDLPPGPEGDEIGKKNFVDGIKRVLPLAEQKKVTLALEMLNSRVDVEMKGHPGYQCDSIEWAVDVCNRVGSDRLKILFDIYHVQIMEGDVVANIRKYYPLIAHFHTAGVPGRHEIDDTQEVNYRFIAKTLVELGYDGFVAHEYRPSPGRDPLESLRQTIEIMDV
jgi:hydroxypyruvate isomerase